MATTSDQCALGPDGKLLDASDIIWLNDPDDLTPIPPKSPIVQVSRFGFHSWAYILTSYNYIASLVPISYSFEYGL